MRRRRQTAFSLLELGVGLALMVIVLTLGLRTLRSSPSRLGTAGAASAVKSFLEQASATARASNQPVGVGFSGETTRELLQIGGHREPRVLARLNLAGDFPKSVIIPGTEGNSEPPQPMGLSEPFDVQSWASRFPDWKLLVFLPSGEVVGRNLLLHQQRYHLLVSSGVELSGDQISRVGFPRTVSVGLLGDTELVTGAGSAFGEPAESGGSLGQPPDVGADWQPVPSSEPVLKDIVITPDPSRMELPPGVEARIRPDGYLSLLAVAESPEGLQLFCQWLDEDEGRMSAAQSHRMSYDWEDGLWKSEWHWRPPDLSRTEYTLRCVVTDSLGRPAREEITATLDIQASNARQRLLFGSNGRVPTGTPTLQTIYEDGSGEQLLLQAEPGVSDHVGAWAPDGSRVALVTDRSGRDELCVVNPDGSDLRQLTSGQGAGSPEWSPTGTRIVVNCFTGGPNVRDVWIFNADGSGQINLTTAVAGDARLTVWQPGGGYLPVAWSPNEDYVTFRAANRLWVVKTDGSEPPRRVSGSNNVSSSAWSPDSSQLAMVVAGEVYTYPLDGSWPAEPAQQSTGANAGGALQYSPDGTRLAYVSTAQGISILTRATGEVRALTAGQFDTCPSWLDDEVLSFTRQLGERDIFTVSTTTGQLKNITDHPAPETFYGWTRDQS